MMRRIDARALLTAGIVISAISLVLVGRRRDTPAPAPTPAAAHEPSEQPRRATTHRLASTLPIAPPADVRPAWVEPEAMRDDARYLADVVRLAVDGDRELALIAHYRNRVLLDTEGRAAYQKMLSDPAMLAKVRGDLSHPPESRENLRDNTRRLMEIDYLDDALAWEANPSREAILGVIEELVLEDNFREGLGLDMRYSLAGNKRELFTLLHEHSQDRALALVDRARGSRLEKLLLFLRDDVQARAQRIRDAAIAP
ncbi:hypothetical protein [Chondromyces crocatus]|uniref:Uncharacterized protein n=1 Tax=Chondromyces crocatus TaxID=52 RepID=A0A0K1E9R7_CHOCO|nr:hypothetical protein [Chondromyces crocatus]AKT37616.1 uncharacterized protein CMC5_017570 [Chondromyces crocatus]